MLTAACSARAAPIRSPATTVPKNATAPLMTAAATDQIVCDTVGAPEIPAAMLAYTPAPLAIPKVLGASQRRRSGRLSAGSSGSDGSTAGGIGIFIASIPAGIVFRTFLIVWRPLHRQLVSCSSPP